MQTMEEELEMFRDMLHRSEEEREKMIYESDLIAKFEDEKIRLALEFEKEIKSREIRISELEERHKEWKKTESELKEFSKELERFVTVKEQYEKTIKEQKEKIRLMSLELRDAKINKSGMKDGDSEELLESGDVEKVKFGNRERINMRGKENRESNSSDDSDWLLPLP